MSPGRELRSKRHLAVSEIVAHTEIQPSDLSALIEIGRRGACSRKPSRSISALGSGPHPDRDFQNGKPPRSFLALSLTSLRRRFILLPSPSFFDI